MLRLGIVEGKRREGSKEEKINGMLQFNLIMLIKIKSNILQVLFLERTNLKLLPI